MHFLHDHAARYLGDIAQRPVGAILGHDDQVARLQRGEGWPAAAAIGHLRHRRRQGAGRAVRKADLRLRRTAVDHHRDAPAFIIDADIAGGQLAFPASAGVDMPHRPGPAAPCAKAQQPVAQRVLGALLRDRVIGAAHPQAAGIDAVGPVLRLLAEAFDQAAAHFLHIIAARPRVEARSAHGDGAQRLGLRLGALRRRDPAIALHLAQRPVAPFHRAGMAGLAFRAVIGRSLGQDRQIGHLMQLEVRHILVEIGTGGRLHAIGVAAEENLIEVQLQNLLLGQHIFHAPGEDHLLHLARGRIFVADQQVLRHLLGDGGPAARALARPQLADIVRHRPGEARKIDAMMLEEGLVLRRQIGADQQRGIVAIL